MTEESFNKGKVLLDTITTIKESIGRIDSVSSGISTCFTIAIPKDKEVMAAVRKALSDIQVIKQSQFNSL